MTSSEAAFSFTTKVGGDLFTVRGNSAAEFKTNLEAAVTADLITYATAVQEAAAGINAVDLAKQHLGATVQPAAPSTPNPWQQPAQAAPAAPANGPTCAHGAMTYKEGVAGPNAKTPGKPYKMWACPSRDRSDQCKAVWV